MIDRARARTLAAEAVKAGEPTAWFERLYAEAGGEAGAIPWADRVANPHFRAWAREIGLRGEGKRALKIGCGLGDDAEEMARLGFAVTAFDVSPTAVAWAKQRFSGSSVEYVTADLLAPPAEWRGAFDLVVEIYTLQVLPADVRQRAIERVAELVAPGGTLFVFARGREETDGEGAMPWPLTRNELDAFESLGLVRERIDDFLDDESPPVRRFRAVYRRA